MAVAEAVAELPEVDYVVITAGTYDILIETVCEDNEGLLRLPRRASADDRRRPRHRDVRVPADGQADLPVGHALGRRSRACTVRANRDRRGAELRDGLARRDAAKMAAGRCAAVRRRLPCVARSPGAGRASPDAAPAWRSSPTSSSWAPSASPFVRRTPPAAGGRRSTPVRRLAERARPVSGRIGDPTSRRSTRRLRSGRPDRQLGRSSSRRRRSSRSTGLWPETQAGDLRPAGAGRPVRPRRPRPAAAELARARAKFVVEGSVAITFATLLVLLTGGDESPFFFTFPLIVGGAALVVSPAVTFALAAVASLGYIFAVRRPAPGPRRRR